MDEKVKKRMDSPNLVVNCGNPQITLNCQEENRNTITKCNEVTYLGTFWVYRGIPPVV